MDLFLKIFGGIALLAIMLIGGLILFVRLKFRTLARSIAGNWLSPSTINLTEEENPEWLQKQQVQDDLASLESCGYVRAGAYLVEGIPGAKVVMLHHPAMGAFAAYYDHPLVGNWIDLCLNFADGLELTISNAPDGNQMDTRPSTEKIFLQGKVPSELHTRLLQRMDGREVQSIAAADLRAEFIAAYARDMAWRNAKGGTSEAEFLRVAASESPLSDEQLQNAFEQTKLQELHYWSLEAIEAFEKTTTLSIAQWRQYEDQLFLFSDSFHPKAYLSYLTSVAPLEEEQVVQFRRKLDDGANLGELLPKIAAETGSEFVKLGEVKHPVKAEIYGIKALQKVD